MSDIIQLLPDSVANQIAAGEVIQRPASVIKELVENAIDAGADIINVVLLDAGKTLIQVVDNGKGMSATDARLAFERHATSKINKAEDLFALTTMGFRGEALASIAAVAQVELRTRQKGEETGTELQISGGKFMGQEVCACQEGSNFKVENLFYNVPARRKFLKSNSTELNNIVTAFERMVLVYPNISFTLHHNNVEMLNLKSGKTRQRIVDVFGKRLNQDLLPIDVKTSLCRIYGYVGKPESARKKGSKQFFFVNGRYMKHPYFNKAVSSAFERLVPLGEQVPYFIYFEVAPQDIDVNIHPTKTEIKFENEQPIWQILTAAVREAVGKFNDVPTIDFDSEACPDIPVFNTENAAALPKVCLNPQYNPFKEKPVPSGHTTSAVPKDWERLYSHEIQEDTSVPPPSLFPSESNAGIIEEKSPSHYQYKGKYIMTAVKSGLMVVDQHRAHVRILYEQYMSQFANRHYESQKILFPEAVSFTSTEALVFNKIRKEMEELGFLFNDLGPDCYSIISVPAGIEGMKAESLVLEMVCNAKEKNVSIKEEIDSTLALTLAKNAAIPYGQVLTNEEMENLVNKLFCSGNVNYTPNGKPIIGILRQQEIEHLFS